MEVLRRIVTIVTLILLQDCTAALSLMAAPLAPFSGRSIIYNSYDLGSGKGIARLASIESDGSNDRLVDLSLIDPTYPVWSKDGQILALTATDPQRPDKASPDIFLLSAETFEISKITDFQVTAGGGGFAYVLALHKAFSPDKTRIAVSFYTIAGGSGVNQVPSVTNIVNGVTNISAGHTNNVSGISVVPSLQVFNVDGTPGIPMLMMFPNEGLNHGGDGVDWAPGQNQIVYPVKIEVPFENSPLNSYVTALFLLDPVFEPILSGRSRQLTFPKGRLPPGIFSQVVIEWQDDFQPAVSPNGQEVAYIRADSHISSFAQMASVPSLRIIRLDGSNDREVVKFQQGDYVTHVNWSPEGNQLVFDFGKQVYSGGSPLQLVSSNTVELFTINVDGTGLRKLRAPAAGWPAWQPGPAILPATITALNPTAASVGGRGFDLLVTGADFSRASVVQWNGAGLQTEFVSATQLRAFVPADSIAAEGVAFITVAAPGVETSNVWIFTINASVVGPPRLEISVAPAPSGREIVIQWPAAAADFVLETTRTPATQDGWQEVGMPVMADGQRRVAVNPDEAARFYRLRRP
jgi:hypothetical protein